MANKIAAVFILVLLIACSHDKVQPNLAPVSEFTPTEQLDRIQLDASLSRDPNNDVLSYTWSSTSPDIFIKPTGDNDISYFMLPKATTSNPVTITLKVSDHREINTSSQTITVPELTESRSFGLGKNVTQDVSLNQPYEWYMDQNNTGMFSNVNCGPTSVSMAIKWAQPNFTGTPIDARNTYRSGGGWWYTDDILKYLGDNHVTTWTIALNGMDGLKDELTAGNIAILCLDMFSVPLLTQQSGSDFHKDKFYDTDAAGWGHFIVIKGFKEVDGVVYFEAYDPYSFGRTYTDNVLKGKNRYYTSYSLDKATQFWWDYAIIVSKGNISGGRRMVNTSEIVHMPGK